MKQLDFEGLDADGSVTLATAMREYSFGREHTQTIVQLFMNRALGDYDPISCQFYLYDEAEIEEKWRPQFEREHEELASDIELALAKAKIPSPVGTPVPYGLEGKKSFTAQPRNGLHSLFALQCQYYSVRAMYQESVVNRITDAAEHFRGGNPATKIEKIVRPALKEAMRLQLQVKAVNTLHPMMRVLNKRDDAFKQLSDMARYKDVVPNLNCSSLLMQFLSDVERVCKDVVSEAKVSAEIFWKANKIPVREEVQLKKAFRAHYSEEEVQQMVEEEDSEAYYDAEDGGDRYEDSDEEEQYVAQFGKGSKGGRGKGAGRGGSYKGSGGKGGKAGGQRSGQVKCDCSGCWNFVKANSTKKWGHICAKCVAWAARKGRNSYRNRMGQMVQLEGMQAQQGEGFVATDRERALAKTVLNAVERSDKARQQAKTNHAQQVSLTEPKYFDAEEPSVEDEQVIMAQMAKRQKTEGDDGTMSGCMAGLLREDDALLT